MDKKQILEQYQRDDFYIWSFKKLINKSAEEKMKIIICFVMVLLTIGCAASSDKVSDDIYALKEEQKQLYNLELALNGYIKARDDYKQKLKEWKDIREKHEDRGWETGPDYDSDESLEDQKKQLKQNIETLSERIEKLEEKRRKLINEEEGID
jgi:hypothetical protein